MSSGPLAGVTVIENASYISGHMAGLLLAQLGADVVKVEAPGSGDPFRRWGGATAGVRVRPQFAALNHGKRSVALDLRTPEGQAGYLDVPRRDRPAEGENVLVRVSPDRLYLLPEDDLGPIAGTGGDEDDSAAEQSA
jgi:hypothetical protein